MIGLIAEETIADDPDLPVESSTWEGWYKLGICYQKIGASIRAYEHALDQSEAPRSIEQNLWQDLLLTERWKEDGKQWNNEQNLNSLKHLKSS